MGTHELGMWVMMLLLLSNQVASVKHYDSAVGDPGMRTDGLRVAFEGWNFCNEVGHQPPGMPSPRAADCFDFMSKDGTVEHKVTEADNRLGAGDQFPGLPTEALNNPDLYAVYKELYLGSLCQLPESPNFKVRLTLDIKRGGGAKSQFYLIDIGSCWKNDGSPCDGDVLTDVTRYSEMIINPETKPWCTPANPSQCPPYHITPNNTKVYRNDTARFPYAAYHLYCGPGNAKYLEEPVSICDPYSNPQAQELLQLLPHPIWEDYGYPTKPGDGWTDDSNKSWELDVGALSSRLYFYQDPGSPPARRIWTSIDVGTEIYVSDEDEVAEWSFSDFDVILTSVAGGKHSKGMA
ncbi:hypothetical protein LINPERPRIM_LOCUS5668 [Linum perenne]